MLSIGKWTYEITEEDDGFVWSLSYDYNNEFMVESKSFKTFKACKNDALKQMEKMYSQFGKLILKAREEEE